MQYSISFWQAVVAALIGAVAVLSSQFLSQIMTNRREKQQADHREMLKVTEFEEARLLRLRDERIKAYTEFARLTYTYQGYNPAAISDVVAAYSTVRILEGNPALKDAADLLYQKIAELRDCGSEIHWIEEEGRRFTADPLELPRSRGRVASTPQPLLPL